MQQPSFQRHLMAWVLDHRMVVMGIVLAVTLVLGYQLRDPSVLFQTRGQSFQEDTGGNALLEHADRFGEGELLMVVLQAENIFTPEVLTYIRSISETIAEVDLVRKVASLTHVPEITMVDGTMITRPFFADIPTDPKGLATKKKSVLSNPLWANNLISQDGTVAVINVFLPPMVRGSQEASQAMAAIQRLTEKGKPESVEIYMTGLSPMIEDSLRSAKKDFGKFFLWTWGLMMALLFIAFRTIRGIVLPLAVTFLAVFWTLGLMVLAGQTISTVGVMLPTLIGVICFSDAVHVMAHYYEQLGSATNRRDMLLATMDHMIPACFLTSITTAVAFGSLVVAELSSIRQFGLWAAIGIMLGYVLITVVMPIILSWLPQPANRVRRQYDHSLLDGILKRVAQFSRTPSKWVAVVTVATVLLCLAAIPRLRFETSMTAFLPDTSPSMQGCLLVQDKCTGFGSVELEVKGEAGSFEEPWALREIRKLEAYLEKQPEVGFVRTIGDFLQWVHTIAEDTDQDLLAHPKARGLIAEYLFLLSDMKQRAFVNALISEDYAIANLSARLHTSGAGEQIQLMEALNTYIREHLDKRFTVTITGDAHRLANQIQSMLRSLLLSLGTTMLVIVCLMVCLLRNIKAALLAMIPNILPLLMTLGLMGVLDISLNFATIMIASIAIGIAVDDTIHFLVRYRREMHAHGETDMAIGNTLRHSGRAIAFTSVTIAAGCSLFVFSDFAPNRNFGYLMAFTMMMALLTDFLVLPYLLKRWPIPLTPRRPS